MKPAYRSLPKDWVTVAEAAQLLSVSKVAVYKALNVGRLEFQVIEGRKCIEARNLRARFWGSSQRVVDRPVHARDAGPNWAAVADRLNEFLSDWPSPPWTADQVNTLVVCVEMAQEAAG